MKKMSKKTIKDWTKQALDKDQQLQVTGGSTDNKISITDLIDG